MDAPYENAGAMLSATSSRAAARRIRRTKQRLGSYRHDLLVAMRVVNSIEREMVQSEWENWLTDETMRCDQLKMVLDEEGSSTRTSGKDVDDDTGTTGEDEGQGPEQAFLSDKEREKRARLRLWHDDYCGSCKSEQLSLRSGGESMAGV